MTGALLQPSRNSLRRATVLGLCLLASVPVAYIVTRFIQTNRNIAFWDEYSLLSLLLRLDTGMSWQEFIAQIFQIDSEHRMVTSRLIGAASYWVSGAVNFSVIAVVGNLFLVGLCAILVTSARSVERRVRLVVLLAFGLFQLEHYEMFFWGGASIDHFQVVLLAGGTMAALARGTRSAAIGAGVLALLATFTLAHGCVVWVLGAAVLGHGRHWRQLAAWSALAIIALAIFFHGFEIHAAHRVTDFSAAGLGRLAWFWLALLGGPLTFGAQQGAPLFGLLLLIVLGWLGVRGAWTREPVMMPLALFAVVSLGLVAFGRLGVSGSQINSRYLVLGSLAWALTAFMTLERLTDSARPYRLLAWCLPGLIAFNLAANLAAAHAAETFVFSRDYPAVRFKQYGEEGHAGPFRLHPDQGAAKAILAQTEARGIYQLPRLCHEVTVPAPQSNPNMVTYVTDLTVSDDAVGFEGWAMMPKQKSKRGQIHVMLRSAKSSIILSTFSVARPDVAKAFKEPLWRYCGYNFVLRRARLPQEDFQVGLLISDRGRSEIKMTEHWIKLARHPLESPRLATTE
ncbi:MAG: hypothetical protein EXS32_02225 [Opitutus sp.]|nr:hypothetical protein [Opitutus sp.]